MKNKFILESLASDLKRVAMGLHRNSNLMAGRFIDEALKRKAEVDTKKVAPYIQGILKNLNNNIDADDALMYSTLIQNYTQTAKF